MLKEIDRLRGEGHTIGIDGSGNKWNCEFDGVRYSGATPMAAFEEAKRANEGK